MLRAEAAGLVTVAGVVVVSRRSPLLALKELKGSLCSIAGETGDGSEFPLLLLLLR